MFDCEREDLVQVRTLHQDPFARVHDNAPSRLTDFIHQDNTFGVTAYIFEYLKCRS